jgi:DUF4097 and DUF4098 domain-containing protein YvlB
MNDETRQHSFQTPGPIRLRVEIPHGRIKVAAEATDSTRVELTAIHNDATARAWIADAEVAQNGEEIVVRVRKSTRAWLGWGGGVEACVHAPIGSAAMLSAGAGEIETTGRLGDVIAQSGSGTIDLGDNAAANARTGSGNIAITSSSGSVDAKTGSGRITVGKVCADARISAGSGHVELGEAVGDARLATGSGDIEVGQAGDSLEAVAASGSIKVRRADHGRARLTTNSGRIWVGVANGAAALLDITTMSGRVDSELEAAEAPAEGEGRVELVVSTLSGNVNLVRA